jgi:hypothetical protein
MTTADDRLVVTPSMLRVPIVLCAIGVIALAAGLATDSDRAWLNLLVDGFYVLSLGVLATFFIGAQRLAHSKWWSPIRRIPEAFSMLLPVGAVLMIVLAFGFRTLYPWTDAHSPDMAAENEIIRAGRFTYLAPPFVYARMIIITGVWIGFALRMRQISIAGDASRAAGNSAYARLFRYSGVFVPLFAITFALATYDWLISLKPKWFSTMYSVNIFAGSFVEVIAAIALATVLLKRRQLWGKDSALIDIKLIQTLGTMMLAFSTFWGYTWICQYLLVWYANIPDEAAWFVPRSSGGWMPLYIASFVVSWIIPFFTLLPFKAKSSLKVMTAVAILILAGRWFDLYLQVMPSHWSSPRFGWIELGMAAGTAGLIWLVFVRVLARAPLVPVHEPVIEARRGHAHH